MQQFLKHYRVKIRVLSPIHIGSGEKIKKKEYIYMPWNHRVIIPNVKKMYEWPFVILLFSFQINP